MFQKHDLLKETSILEALRGVAALLVLLSHGDAYFLIRYDLISEYKAYLGKIGVYVFFMLSGFLIWSSAARTLPGSKGLMVYFIHRAARIMPLYYVALAFGVIAFPILSPFPAEINFYTVTRHILFSQALSPPVDRAINPILWTLTHEAIFYCVVPMLFLFRRVFPAIVCLTIIATWYGWHSAGVFSPFLQLFYLFVIGMILAQYQLTPTFYSAAFSSGLAILLAWLGFSHLSVSVAWAFALFAAAASLRRVSNSMPVKALAFVGTISYSLYVWHYMLIEMVGPALLPYRPYDYPNLTAVGFMALCLFVSWVSYRAIEKPAQIRLRATLTKVVQPRVRPEASIQTDGL